MTFHVHRDKETGDLIWEHETERQRRIRAARIIRRAKRGAITERAWGEFLRMRISSDDDKCWGWAGARRGEAGITHGHLAHVIAWLYHTGGSKLKHGAMVWHLCERMDCVNPYHLIYVDTGGKGYRAVIVPGLRYVNLSADLVMRIEEMRMVDTPKEVIAREAGLLLSELEYYLNPRTRRLTDRKCGE